MQEGYGGFEDVGEIYIPAWDAVAEFEDSISGGALFKVDGKVYDVSRELEGDTPRETEENLRQTITEREHPRYNPGKGQKSGMNDRGDADISAILSGEEPMLGGS